MLTPALPGRALMRAPIHRLDSYLIATLAGVTGADRAVRLVAQVADPQSLAAVARRFVEVEVLRFGFDGGEVYRDRDRHHRPRDCRDRPDPLRGLVAFPAVPVFRRRRNAGTD